MGHLTPSTRAHGAFAELGVRGVGTEHARRLEDDVSAPGVAMLHGLFSGVGPAGEP